MAIPSGVTSIDEGVFWYCGLRSVDIPENVKRIENRAFGWCRGLTSVSLPSSLNFLSTEAFNGTPWYDEFYNSQPDGLIYIGTAAYKYKGIMPEGTIIEIKDGTTSISDHAFSDCTGLKSITIPACVTEIGDYAFRGCESLSSLNLPEHWPTFGRGVFEDCVGITSICIPEGTTIISDDCFSGCTKLAEVSFPKSLIKIGYRSFYHCDSLKSIKLPPRLVRIGESAFAYCGLINVTIPQSVTELRHPFYGNPGSTEDSKKYNHLDYVRLKCRDTHLIANLMYYGLEQDNYYRYKNPKIYVPKGYSWNSTNFSMYEWIDKANYMKPIDLTLCKSGQGFLSIAMANEEDIVGFQFDLILPAGISIATDAEGRYKASLSDRKGDHSLSVGKIDDNTYRFVSVSMNNEKFEGNTGEIIKIKLEVDDDVEVGEYVASIMNTELTSSDDGVFDIIDSQTGKGILTVQEAGPGDVNGDMKVSVSDVASIIGYIVNDPPAVFIEKAANVNGDSKISVTDAVIVIDKILNANTPAGARRTEEPENEPQ